MQLTAYLEGLWQLLLWWSWVEIIEWVGPWELAAQRTDRPRRCQLVPAGGDEEEEGAMEPLVGVGVTWAVDLQQELQGLAAGAAGQLLAGGQVDGVQPRLHRGQKHASLASKGAGGGCVLWAVGARPYRSAAKLAGEPMPEKIVGLFRNLRKAQHDLHAATTGCSQRRQGAAAGQGRGRSPYLSAVISFTI